MFDVSGDVDVVQPTNGIRFNPTLQLEEMQEKICNILLMFYVR